VCFEFIETGRCKSEHDHSARLGTDNVSYSRSFVVLHYVTACLQADTVKFINIKYWEENNDEFSR